MIRHATHDDIPALLALGKEQYSIATSTYYGHRKEGEPGGWCEENGIRHLKHFIDGDDLVCLVYDDDGELAGYVMAVVSQILDDPRAKLCQEAVIWRSPKSRARGVGKALVAAVTEFAESKGCEMVMFGTNRAMKPRKVGEFYRSLGFSEIGRLYAKRLKCRQ